MEGKSLDNELVALFLRQLGESKYFAKVDLDSTQIVDGRDGLKVVKFAIRAQLVNPDAPAPKPAEAPAPAAVPAAAKGARAKKPTAKAG
jgi:hypothetical protein